MTGAKYKDLILETIDQLRKGKKRPDLEKICLVLIRKHELRFEDIVLDIEKLVEDNVVEKVDFKGRVSYRNAVKPHKLSEFDQEEFLKKVEETVELIGKEVGEINVGELEKRLPVLLPSPEREELSTALQILTDQQKIVEKKEGVFVLKSNLDQQHFLPRKYKVKLKPRKEMMETKIKQKSGTKRKKLLHNAEQSDDYNKPSYVHESAQDEAKSSSPVKKGRAPTKRKRIKKTHGPDFESYFFASKSFKLKDSDKTKRVSPVSSEEELCDFCEGTAEKNKISEQPEELICCKDCSAKAHPSCLGYSEDLGRRALNSPWQCANCKICYVCQDSGDAVRNEEMLICDSCDKGYHMDCHNPEIVDKPTGNWICSKCIEEDERENASKSPTQMETVPNAAYSDSNSTVEPTPRHSPIQVAECKPSVPVPSLPSQCSSYSSLLDILPSFKVYRGVEVPDASHWSTHDVATFLTEAGFSDEANVFLEQEIDGTSLLLMKRADVLLGLDLKLGPALKIYAHIQRLQAKGSFIV